MRASLATLLAVPLGVFLSGCQCCQFRDEGSSDDSPDETTWTPLFDGKTLDGWRPSTFLNPGEPRAENGQLILPVGEILTGVTWTKDFPKKNYEIRLEAMRVDGSDFFCGLTFPYKENFASLILGGWGGQTCGISSLDSFDASSNTTTTFQEFKSGIWYKVRLRVTDWRFEAWLDEKKIVDVSTKEKMVDIRIEVEPSLPLGFSSFQTTAALRNIEYQEVDGPENAAPKTEG